MSINKFPTEWRSAWNAEIRELREQYSTAHIYALIEGVHNEACYTYLKHASHLGYQPVYATLGYADEETLAISPILVEYEESRQANWNALLAKLDGLPALSLIVTPESIGQLSSRLAPWCVVEAGGYTLGLSFADTRVLPELIAILTPRQAAELCGPALHWRYLGRTAEWCALALPQTESIAPVASTVKFDEAQYGHLVSAAEADGILFQLRQTSANLVDCHTPAAAHRLVRFWLDCADHAQIESVPERRELCEFGLAQPGLENNAGIHTWLKEPSKACTLETLQTQRLSALV